MAIEFSVINNFSVVPNPTSLQFGPDGRLYVSAQTGDIVAYTLDLVDGQVVVLDQETLTIGDTNLGVVKSISNHDDDGELFSGYDATTINVGENPFTNRQVTGLVVGGTAENPVLYVSSSDPRISSGQDNNLDTNSGVVTRVTLDENGEWQAVDIIRGLPRSEENHSVNGMVLDEATNTLYLQVGGNTNNGAPSTFFANTPEYTLSGTLLEIDLDAIEAIEAEGVKVDPTGGRFSANNSNNNGNSLTYVDREYVYDLPTLDDPNRENAPAELTDEQAREQGFLEDSQGLDLNGPFGGSDGFNQAVIPADSPIRIFADGERNAYDVVLRSDGKFFTLDNGGNGGLGGNPVEFNGEPVNVVNPGSGGDTDDEPLQLISEGAYLGHPNATRANQDGVGVIFNDVGEVDQDPSTFTAEQLALMDLYDLTPITLYDGILDDGTADPNYDPEQAQADFDARIAAAKEVALVADISALVPDSLGLPDGFLIDPSRFAAGDGQNLDDLTPAEQEARLAESGDRIDRTATGAGNQFDAVAGVDTTNPADIIAYLDNSSNGITEYKAGNSAGATGQALDGALIVAGLDGNVVFFNVNSEGTGLDPFVVDGVEEDSDGIVVENLPGSQLDVTVGPEGSIFEGIIFSAGFGPNNITALIPSDTPLPDDPDLDDDGLFDINDPFSRDASNGGSATLGGTDFLILDFDNDQDGNLRGPDGFGSGLTGLAINGTDNPEFLLFGDPDDPSDSGQFGNLRIGTAAGGGLVNIVDVPAGTSAGAANNAPLLLQSGFRLSPAVETFTVRWVVGNPGLDLPADNEGNTNSFVSGANQEVGGYLGTGDQSNILRVVATHAGGESPYSGAGFIISFENDDVLVSEQFISVPDLFDGVVETDSFVETFSISVVVDRAAGTATPTIDINSGPTSTQTVVGQAIDISGTNLESAFNNELLLPADIGPAEVSGVALGLFATNGDAAPEDAFSAVFDLASVETTGLARTVVYRVNFGGSEVAAIDGGPNWAADQNNNSQFRDQDSGASNTSTDANGVTPGATVPITTPDAIFNIARFDPANTAAGELTYIFPNLEDGLYEVTLFLGNGFAGASNPGDRIFDVSLEGQVPSDFDNLDPVALFTNNTGGAVTTTVEVTDGALDVVFLHVVENPNPFGIEIAQLGDGEPVPQSVAVGDVSVDEDAGTVLVTFTSATAAPPSETLTVTFDVIAGTATGEVDFDIEGEFFNNDTTSFIGLTAEINSGDTVSIPISIFEDLEMEGDETFTVQITGVASDNAETQISFDAGAPNSSATVTIVDNDTAFLPGEVLIAVNAGGPGLTQTVDGEEIAFAANTGGGADGTPGGSGGFFLNGSQFTDSGSGNGPQPIFDGTVFETERFGGAGDTPLGFEAVLDNGTYIVDLYFAEIFQPDGAGSGIGARVFDVVIEGETVLSNFDVLSETGGDINQSVIESFEVVVADGVLDIDFSASSDNAKVSAVVIREAIPNLGGATISLGAPAVAVLTEGDGGASVFEFPLTFNAPPSEAVTVNYTVTINGVAQALSQAFSGDGVITVTVPDDDVDNGDEDITVTLDSLSVGAEVATIDPSASSASATVEEDEFTPPSPGDLLFRINAGGPEVAATDGEAAFTADQSTANVNGTATAGTPSANFVGASNHTFGSEAAVDVSGVTEFAAPEALFQTERFDPALSPALEYEFDVPAGTEVEITLFFSEGFTTIADSDGSGDASGDRTFDIVIDDVVVAADYDIFAEAGGFNIATAFTTTVVSDGTIDIDLEDGVQNPLLNGIEIRAAEDAVDTTPPAATVAVGLPATAFDDLVVTITFDEAVDVASNALDASEVALSYPITEGGALTRTDGVVVVAADGLSATVTFAAPIQGFANGAYSAELAAGAVQDAAGNATALSTGSATLALALDANEIYDENVDGDLSDANDAPSALPALSLGSNIVTLAAIDADDTDVPGGNPLSDRDYFTVEVPAGFLVSQINLVSFESTDNGTDNPAFLAVSDEATINFSVDEVVNGAEPEGSNLIGSALIDANGVSTNILDDLGAALLSGSGFNGLLPEGAYTFWLNQNAGAAQVSLDFVMIEVVDSPPVIDPATPMAITIDENVTEVLSSIDATDADEDAIVFSLGGADADLFDINPETGALSFKTAPNFELPGDADGNNVYVVDVIATANSVPVSKTIEVTVADVDEVIPLTRGDVVAAINAGGPALTFNGIAFSANTGGAANAGVFNRGNTFTDGSGSDATQAGSGNGIQQDPDSPFATERNAGGANTEGVPLTATIDVSESDADLFDVDLYFAELFQEVSARIFDVFIEGELVIDNLDVISEVGFEGPDANVIKTIEGVSAGDDGVITIEFVNEATLPAEGPNDPNPSVAAIVVTELVPDLPRVELGAPAQPVLTEGNGGASIFEFPVTFSETPPAAVTVEYELDINGVTQTLTQEIPVEGGVITVSVADDAVFNNDDIVTVTLTSLVSGEGLVFLPGGQSETAQVVEDEALPPRTVVLAVNAGNAAGITQTVNGEEIVFSSEADATTAGDIVLLSGTGTFNDGVGDTTGGGNNGPQPGFDGTVFDSERFSGGDAAVAYQLNLDPNESYTIEVYFAEIFLPGATGVGLRQIDVLVDDTIEIDNFDILAAGAGDINAPSVIEIPKVFNSGSDGVINLSFADVPGLPEGAKVSGFVVRQIDDIPVSIAAPAAPTLEGGDDGFDVLEFGLTAPGFEGTTDVTFTVNGSEEVAVVEFVAGVATLSVSVPQDDLADGPDAVSVTLVSLSSGALIVNAAAASAVGTVDEDDNAPVGTVSIASFGGVDDDLVVSVTFSEAVTGLESAEVSLTTPEGVRTDGVAVLAVDGLSATVTFAAPEGGFTDGDYSAALIADAVQDAGGNGNAAAASSVGAINFDLPAATVSLALPDALDEAITINLAFSEPVFGLEATEVTLTGPDGLARTDGVLSFVDGGEAAFLTFAAPEGGFAEGDYAATLVAGAVLDGAGGANVASVAPTVTLDVDQSPVFVDPVSAASTPEGTVAVATFAAVDPDGEAVTLTLEGADAALFDIDADGRVTFVSAPDFETGPTSFSIEVVATSTGTLGTPLEARQAVAVTVLDGEEDESGPDNDVVVVDEDTQEVELSNDGDNGGEDTVSGTEENLKDLKISNFEEGDSIEIVGDPNVELVGVREDSILLDFSNDGDASTVEFTIEIEGSEANSETGEVPDVQDFAVETVDGNTVITFAPVPDNLPIRVQAEDFSLDSGFFTENQGTADGGEVIRLGSNTVGVASLDIDTAGITPGENVVSVTFFDENDGTSQIRLLVDNNDGQGQVEVGTVTLDQNTGGNIAQPQNLRTATFTNVTLAAGAVFFIEGTSNAAEFVRVDYVEFTAIPDTTDQNQAPAFNGQIDPVTLTQGEAFELPINETFPGFSDPDEDPLTFVTDNPLFSVVDGVLTATPTNDDALAFTEPFDVTITATDPSLASVSTTFTVQAIVNANDAPEFAQPTPVQGETGEDFSFDIDALVSDIDGDDVLVTVEDLPPGLTYSAETGLITGTPTAGGSFQATITLDDQLGADNSVLQTTLIFNITGGVVSADPVRIQAEDLALGGAYFVENQGAADDGQVIRLPGGAVNDGIQGAATLTIDANSPVALGVNQLDIVVFDESDGESSISVTKNGAVIGTFTLDQSGGGNAAQSQNLRTLSISEVEVAVGDVFVLTGTRDDGEFVRVDYLEFTAKLGEPGNFAPTVIPTFEPDNAIEIPAGQTLELLQVFADPEEDALTFGVTDADGAPIPFLSIVNDVLVVAPDAPEGVIDIILTATDAEGSNVTVSRALSLTVEPPQEIPPLLASEIVDALAPEDAAFTLDVSTNFTATVDDLSLPGGDDIAYSFAVTPLNGAPTPTWLQFDTATGVFTGTPLQADIGQYEVTVTATDDDGAVSDTFVITVENVNDAPVPVDPAPSVAATVDALIETPIDVATFFTDEDLLLPASTEQLTFSLLPTDDLTTPTTGLPAGVTFDPTTGLFSGTPTEFGVFTAAVVATDVDGASATQVVTFNVAPAGPLTDGAALFTANITGGDVVGSSTFAENSLQITNNSANDVSITRVVIDLADTLIPDTGFDSRTVAEGGPIGDATNKPFDQGSATSGFTPVGGNGQGGPFDFTITMGDEIMAPAVLGGGLGDNQLILEFDPGVFAVGDVLSFSIDIDPFTATVGAIGGAVAGFEITGGTVTVDFSDGSTATSAIVPNDGAVAATAVVQAGQETLGAPTLTLGDGTTDARVVNQADLPISIDAGVENANGLARVYILDTAFVSNGASAGDDPEDIGLPEIFGNNAQATATVVEVQLDAEGKFDGTIPVTRSTTQEGVANENLGINYFAAGVVDGNGNVTQLSAPLVVEFDPSANVDPIGSAPEVVLRINAFGPELAALDDGPNFLADTTANPSPFFVGSQNRGDTDGTPAAPGLDGVPDALFTTARSNNPNPTQGANFSYDVDLAAIGQENGTYEVRLFFAEAFDGNNTAGARVFDVNFEGGAPEIVGLDVADQFNGGGGVITTTVEVTDGELNIDFIGQVDNPILSGLELIALGSGGTVDPVDPTVGVPLLRINAGGPEIAAADGGIPFLADIPFAGAGGSGDLATSSAFLNPITPDAQNRGDAGDYAPADTSFADVVPDAVLDTARSSNGPFSYSIPLSALGDGAEIGDIVTINFYFAETSPASNRSFDVTIEGATPPQFDEIQPGSVPGSFVLSATVQLTDATLDLGFTQGGVNNPIINAIEIVSGDPGDIGPIDPPADPSDALSVLGVDDDDFDGSVQGVAVDSSNDGGSNGSVLLTITDNGSNVATSNFGDDSFEITNTGNKEIAAVFIDIRNAVFGDQVFDIDGTGGDTATDDFEVTTDGDTGAFFVGANNVAGDNEDNLFFPGDTPAADTSGLSDIGGTAPISGGYRGLLIRFDGSDEGFGAGETVGFAGDGDPNSIAGFTSGTLNPNAVTSGNFDTGGQSGAELIGSSFTVLFADGTTATGFLGSDTSQAGAVGEAVQGREQRGAELTVSTGSGVFASDGDTTGTYGGVVPTITVSGQAGDVVRVTLFKGFNPTDLDSGSPETVTEVIQGRLDDAHPEFPVNNAFDIQTFDIQIGANGTAQLPATAFDYNDTDSGISFTGDNVQPLALTAHVLVDAASPGDIAGNDDQVPLGPVSTPVYLLNPTGAPVDEDSIDPPTPSPARLFEAQNGGVVFEAENGEFSDSSWTIDDPSATPDTQGTGFIRWDNPTTTTPGAGEISYSFVADETGEWIASVRMASETTSVGSEENDIFIRLLDSNGDPVVANDQDGQSPVTNGGVNGALQANAYMKMFVGGDKLDDWTAGGSNVDFFGINIGWNLVEGETYTVQVAGRSVGTEIDRIALSATSKGAANNLVENAPESPSQVIGDTLPTVVNPLDDVVIAQGGAFSVASVFDDADGDTLTLEPAGLPNGVALVGTNLVVDDDAQLTGAPVTVTITATDDDNNSVDETFTISIVDTPPVVDVDFVATAPSNGDDQEFGSSIGSGDIESNLGFVVRLTIPDGVSNVTSVTSAILSGVNEDGGSAAPTFDIRVKDTLDPNLGLLEETGPTDDVDVTVSSTPSGPTGTGTRFEIGDIADAVNALIQSQGPLNGGDAITVIVDPTGGRRDIEQGTFELAISGAADGTGSAGDGAGGEAGDGGVSSLRIEAEDGAFDADDFTAVNPSDTFGFLQVDGGPGASAVASLTLSDLGLTEGEYNVVLGFLDETDGDSEVSVSLGGSEIGSFVLNDPNPGATDAAAPQNLREFVIEDVAIADLSEVLDVEVERDEGEFGRFDYIQFDLLV